MLLVITAAQCRQAANCYRAPGTGSPASPGSWTLTRRLTATGRKQFSWTHWVETSQTWALPLSHQMSPFKTPHCLSHLQSVLRFTDKKVIEEEKKMAFLACTTPRGGQPHGEKAKASTMRSRRYVMVTSNAKQCSLAT